MLSVGNLPKLRDVVRQVGVLAELPVAPAVRPDPVHHSGRDPPERMRAPATSRSSHSTKHHSPVATQNWAQCDPRGDHATETTALSSSMGTTKDKIK